jgi:hypothetical protein
MKSAREEVLLWGLVDWFGFERVHCYAAQENAGEPLSFIQDKTLDLIRSLVGGGLLEIGELDDDCRFVAWKTHSTSRFSESATFIYSV